MESAQKLIKAKASLLSNGIKFPIDLFSRVKRPFYENQFVYGQTSHGVTITHKLPQLLRLGKGIVVALLRRQNSPWKIHIDSDRYFLVHPTHGQIETFLPERPAYFGVRLSNGSWSHNVIAVAGEDTPGFFFHPECYYFRDGIPCAFCGMKAARKTVGKDMASEFSPEVVAEATRLFFNSQWRDIPLISISTGTCKNDSDGRARIIGLISAMIKNLPQPTPVHLLTHPPHDFTMIEEYKQAGVTSIAFNLEVYDRKLFSELCPGKSRDYGYDKWLEALLCARDIFGAFNAYCGLVWGLEPVESTMRGNEFFIDNEIGIASNIFHADPTCLLRKMKHPPTRDIMRIIEHQKSLYKSCPDAKTIFPTSMRSTTDREVYLEARS